MKKRIINFLLIALSLPAFSMVKPEHATTVLSNRNVRPPVQIDTLKNGEGELEGIPSYIRLGTGINDGGGLLDLGFQVELSRQIIMSFGYMKVTREAANLPANFRPGFLSGTPRDKISGWNIQLGFQTLMSDQKVGFSISAGPFSGSFNEANFTPYTHLALFDSTHTVTRKKSKIKGFTGAARIRFLVSKTVALEFGVTGNYIKRSSNTMFSFGINLGNIK